MREGLLRLDDQVELAAVVAIVAGLGAVDQRIDGEREVPVRDAEFCRSQTIRANPELRISQIEPWNRHGLRPGQHLSGAYQDLGPELDQPFQLGAGDLDVDVASLTKAAGEEGSL